MRNNLLASALEIAQRRVAPPSLPGESLDIVALAEQERARYSLLSPEEERVLLNIVVKARDAKGKKSKNLCEAEKVAKELLMMCNQGIVIHVVHKIAGPRYPYREDLIQEGNVGLLQAIQLYSPERGCKLGTYAMYWVAKRVRQALKKEYVPREHQAQKCIDAEQIREIILEAEDDTQDREAENREVRKKLTFISLDTTHDLHELIGADSPSDDYVARAEDEERRETIQEVLKELDERSRYIICARFGIGGHRPQTFKEIAAQLGITTDAVRRKEARALHKLRHPRYTRRLKAYL